MPSQWNHESDKDLLLTIIEEGQLKSIDWLLIAGKLQAKGKGYTFTNEACRQHYQKIRKESKTGSTSSSTPKKSTSIKSTPRKGSSDKSANVSFTTNGTSSFGYGHDDDDEEELNNTPMKRKRTNGVKNEVKREGQENSYGYYGGQTGSQFKIEDVSGAMPVVDLEHDDLYEV